MLDSTGWLRNFRRAILAGLAPAWALLMFGCSAIADCNDALIYKQAEVYWSDSKQAISDGDYETALSQSNQGLLLVGDAYSDPKAVDDTGMKLVLAEAAERKGELRHAAHLKFRALESRLVMLKRRSSLCN
ncbi:hypothetical protein [Shewanella zhangzhouensis]|uniref:hypothetical protein n=1 Tax=Shewanella zhangzhouensis TaxID=2864213 RepID=UPI001C656EE7|nr:hypothetical protein [Shewanella zhangzhouensis]QYK04374.1 hypothetical protein K0H63_15045 [Shewanella zhangzhouensis]